MRSPKRRTPAGQWQGFEKAQNVGDGLQGKYTKSAPPSFWQGFGGTQSMAPQIHRRQPKPGTTFWNPERGRV